MEKPELKPDNELFREFYRVAFKEILGADLRILESEVSIKAKEIDEWFPVRALTAMHVHRAIRLARACGMNDEKIRIFLRNFNVEEVPDNEVDLPTTMLQ